MEYRSLHQSEKMLSGPMEARQAVDLVRTRSDYALMKSLKSAFDPKSIFNPGKVAMEL